MSHLSVRGEQSTAAEIANLAQITALGDPNADRILFWDDSAGAYAYLTAGSGLAITGTTMTATSSGDVAGPSSSVDNAIVRFDGTTGKLIQDYTSGAPTISDTGAITASQGGSLTGTWTNLGTVTTIDINGGTVDGAIIGGASAAAITGTVITANTSVLPDADGGAALGSATVGFSILGLSSGSTVNFANSNVVLTHSSGILTMGTGEMRITTVGTNAASVITVGSTSTLTNKTLTSPTITTSPTAAGSTWTDLGTVTTADINGGTLDAVVIGGATAAAATVTTLVVNTSALPDANDGAPLGSATVSWSDLFLASGAVINFANGDATVTHSSALLTSNVDIVVPAEVYGAGWNGSNEVPTKNDVYDKIEMVVAGAGANTALSNLAAVAINTTLVSDTDNTDALGTTAIAWSDIFLGSGAVITFNSAPSTADVTITHSADTLTFAGGTIVLGTATAAGGLTGNVTGNVSGTAATVTGAAQTAITSVGTLTSLAVGAVTSTGLHTVTLAGNTSLLTNTTDNSSVQVAILQGDRATMADNDEAYVSLKLSDDGGTQTEAARITWAVPDVSAGTSVDGRLDFSVMTAGSLVKELQLSGLDLSPSSNDGLALGTTSLGFSDIHLATGAVINVAAGDAVITHSAGIFTVSTGDLRVTTAGTNAASVVTVGGTQTLTNKTLTSPTIGTSPTAAGATWTDLGTVTTADINGGTIDGSVIGGASAAAITGTVITANTSILPDANDGAVLGAAGTAFSDLFLAEGGVINWDSSDATITQTGNVLAVAGADFRIATADVGTNADSVPTISSTNTFTNKRITQRVVTAADDATAVIDVDVTDQYQLTAMANATTISTTGTPTAGQKLVIRLKDNGTARGLTWDGVFRAIGVTLPTTTVISKTHYIGCIYNLTDTKWDAVAVVAEA